MQMPAAARREAVSVESMRYLLYQLAIVGVQDSWWMAADDEHPVRRCCVWETGWLGGILG